MEDIREDDIHALADGLDILLQGQLDLQKEAYGIAPYELMGDELADFLRWNAFALTDELHEAMAEVGWKPWAKSRHINEGAFAKEMVDLLHFFANLCLATGINGGDLAMLYAEKRQRNLERQQEGYDGVTDKCPFCKRDMRESKCYREANRVICEDMLEPLREELEHGFSPNDWGDR